MEVVAEVKTLVVNRKCDKCNNGLMFRNSEIVLTNPLQYTHKCNNCGYEENYTVIYPYHRLVPIENFREATEQEKNAIWINK